MSQLIKVLLIEGDFFPEKPFPPSSLAEKLRDVLASSAREAAPKELP